MSPITTNRAEEGSALNRRVELVEVIDWAIASFGHRLPASSAREP